MSENFAILSAVSTPIVTKNCKNCPEGPPCAALSLIWTNCNLRFSPHPPPRTNCHMFRDQLLDPPSPEATVTALFRPYRVLVNNVSYISNVLANYIRNFFADNIPNV